MSEYADFFDEDFFRGKKGAKRDENSDTYIDLANVTRDLYGGQKYSMLDIGCGVGWVVYNLRTGGPAPENAEGMDVSPWAVQDAITRVPAFCGDVRTLASHGKKWDLLLCHRILSYLPEEDVPVALQQTAQCGDRMFLSALCLGHPMHWQIVTIFGWNSFFEWGRKTLKSANWWLDQCLKAGWVLDEEKMETLLKIKPDWTTGIWCFKK